MLVLGMIGLVVTGSASPDEYFYRAWQTEDGLPENRVVGVAPAADGYLWVATQVGPVWFDGMRFQPVQLEGAGTLFSGTMWGLLRDRNERLWLAKEGGVIVVIDGDTVRALTPQDGLPLNEAQRSMAVDGEGALWVSYTTGKVIRYQDGRVDSFSTAEGLPAAGVCWLASGQDGTLWFLKEGQVGLFRDGSFQVLTELGTSAARLAPARAGGVWICTAQRVMTFDEAGQIVVRGELPAPSSRDRAAMDPSVLLESESGAVWVGTASAGLFCCASNRVTRVGTSHPGILTLTEDQEGNLWVGTRGGGLNRVRRRVVSLSSTESGLPFESVQSVTRDARGGLWTVGQNGVLARRIDGRWQELAPEAGDHSLFVNCVEADAHGSVYVGTRGGSLYRWSEGRFTNLGLRSQMGAKSVRALLFAPSGELWEGTDDPSALFRLKPESGELQKFDLPRGFRFIRALAAEPSGAIWVGASDGLLVRIDQGEVTDHTTRTGARSIRCLHVGDDGDLWVGSAGFGVG